METITLFQVYGLVLVRAVALSDVPAIHILLLPAFRGQLPKARPIATGWWGDYYKQGGDYCLH